MHILVVNFKANGNYLTWSKISAPFATVRKFNLGVYKKFINEYRKERPIAIEPKVLASLDFVDDGFEAGTPTIF